MYYRLNQWILDNTKDRLSKVQESSSVFIAVCPVCKGNKLKINLHTGAYSCYSNYCFSKDTYNYKYNKYLLYKQLEVDSNNIDRFKYTSTVKEYIEPKLITNELKLATVIKQPKYTKQNNITTYYYDNYHRVIRTDLDNKKTFLPQYYDLEQYQWINGKDGLWKAFKPIKYSLGTILALEGEGNVLACCSLGIASFTFRTYTPDEIDYALKDVKCNNVITIADNDLIGIKKAKLVQERCWKLSIACDVIETKELWLFADITKDCIGGSDLKDIIDLKPSIDLEVLINNYVCSRN